MNARLLVLALLLAWPAPAHAAAPPPGSPQADMLAPYGDWVRGLRNPASGVGCCSLSDCRAVEYRIAAGGAGYDAFLDAAIFPGAPGAWRPVPPEVVLRTANPTGSAVACWAAWRKESAGFFCFAPAGGV